MNLYKKEVIHYPNLKTLIVLEEVLKKSHLEKNVKMTRAEIKRKLPKKIMHQTLNIALKYLEERGLIEDSHDGVKWIFHRSDKKEETFDKKIENFASYVG